MDQPPPLLTRGTFVLQALTLPLAAVAAWRNWNEERRARAAQAAERAREIHDADVEAQCREIVEALRARSPGPFESDRLDVTDHLEAASLGHRLGILDEPETRRGRTFVRLRW